MDNQLMDLPLTPWDFMPPEQHFPNPGILKNAIFEYQLSRLLEWERNDSKFLLTPGKFEVILNNYGKFSLWPVAMDYVFLFRGQRKFYPQCYPTLYRGDKTQDEIFLERLKLVEFELLISQYPAVEFFNLHNIEVDYLGLAQHYLIDTEILDLTTDLDVAMFFAMCDFDGHNYHPKTEEQEYIAYIYSYPFAAELNIPDLSLTHRVKPIGLQPFKRPGEQKGFSIKMQKDQSFKTTIYSFSFTKQDSEYIFNWFTDNRPLFFEDEFSKKVDLLRNSKTYSISALRLAAKRYSIECYGKRKSSHFCQKRLNELEYHFTDNILPWTLTDSDIYSLRKTFIEKSKQEFTDKLVVRKIIDKENGEMPYQTEESFAKMLMLRMFMGGCPALPGYDAEFEIAYTDKDKMTMMSYNYGRPQTIPNKETGKIDKWDYLDWTNYSKLTIDKNSGKVVVDD
ncbi:FRG domain-containing protein [Bacteroides sp. AN502(2024)]|uniref:FRG domain-containing protein n=1 Tax=Bacteroides sp. AN502(2024) TaxID=3160599 RepID=UPI003511BEED